MFHATLLLLLLLLLLCFVAQLGSVAFVPVARPEAYSFERGHRLAGEALVLAAFSDIAMPRDRHLTWTVQPVCPAHLAPPQVKKKPRNMMFRFAPSPQYIPPARAFLSPRCRRLRRCSGLRSV